MHCYQSTKTPQQYNIHIFDLHVQYVVPKELYKDNILIQHLS